MHHKNNRPEELDLGSSTFSLTSLSSDGGYRNGALHCANNENFNLDFMEERAIRGNNRGNFDEIDLVSECSTPSVYTPGKYLQLCDIYSPSATDVSDTTLWPSSLGAPPADWDTTALVLYQKKSLEDSHSPFLRSFKSQSSVSERHYRKVRCLPNKFLVIIAVCLIIALSGLGSLAVLI